MRAPLLALLLSLLLCQPARAAVAELEGTNLKPFRATYTGQLEAGVALSSDAVRELKQQKDGSWQFVSAASALVASQREQTRFSYKAQHVRPLSYHYRREVLGHTREVALSFDWDQRRVTTIVKNKPWHMAVPPDVQDKLSYQLQLRVDLEHGAREFTYSVADGGLLKEYRFRLVGKEPVDTPYGHFDALKVERVREADSKRSTYIWFAPALDYLIVQLYQVEPDGKEYGLSLKNLEQP